MTQKIILQIKRNKANNSLSLHIPKHKQDNLSEGDYVELTKIE